MPNCASCDVAIGFVHQFAHEIFDVAAHIAGLAELRRVRFDERNFDQIRDMFDQIGFPDAGRSHQDDVLLGVFRFFRARGVFLFQPAQIIDVVVVIADRDREDLLRFVLFDHEPIEMRLDVARQKIEDELLCSVFAGFSSPPASAVSGSV